MNKKPYQGGWGFINPSGVLIVSTIHVDSVECGKRAIHLFGVGITESGKIVRVHCYTAQTDRARAAAKKKRAKKRGSR